MSDLQLLTLGRVNLDLYAQQHGVAFADVVGWDAMVGGSPVNVALAATRLEVRTAVLTAVGDDLVGEWVLHALAREGVEARFVARKHGPHTSLAMRAQLAPDHPLAFYRHDPADIHLTSEDVRDAPVEEVAALLVSADALARGEMVDTCRSVLRRARRASTTTYLDLDLRDVNWSTHQAYADVVRDALGDVDVIVGTELEFGALLGVDAVDVVGAVEARLSPTPDRVVIVKHGDRGATVFAGDESVHAPAFAVTEGSSVGAGDSFAAGLIAARGRGDDWRQATRLASACAAITVSRFGCSTGFPHRREVSDFLEAQQRLVATERA